MKGIYHHQTVFRVLFALGNVITDFLYEYARELYNFPLSFSISIVTIFSVLLES